MAQQYISDAGVLTIPGGYSSFKVQSGATGLSTTGVMALIGEADAGPDWSLEPDLTVGFGSDQLAAVVAKYKTGNLVDAYRGASAAANDPNIQGSPAKILLIKTNVSVKATSALPKVGGGTYATLADLSYGKLGNLIYWTTKAATAEVVPTTGTFTFLPPIAATDMSVRVNGGAAAAYTISALQTPTAFVAGLAAAAPLVAVTGGADRLTITAVAGTLGVTVVGNIGTFTVSTTWANNPVAGDTLFISSTSAIKGGASQNCGSWVVTAATASTITATKLMDQAGTPGTLTAPLTVAPQTIASTTADLRAFAPVTIAAVAGAVVPGIGKTIEINELVSNTDRLSNLAYQFSGVKVTWVSKTGAATQLVSATEQSITLGVNRQLDSVQEIITAGGQIALQIGYLGTSASVVISPTTFVTTVVGGAGASLSLKLTDYKTLNDLAAYINAQPGYTCVVGSSQLGQLLSLALDEGTFTFGSNFGALAGRIKVDAAKFFTAVSGGSSTVQLGVPPAQALAGLPDVSALSTYLASGAKGGTTDAGFQAAMDALQAVPCNAVVPLFSSDSTVDIAAATTDSTSTYTIAATNAYAKTHVLTVSTKKRRKSRQAYCSIRDTYANVKAAAGTLASGRVSLCFQDVKDVGAAGIVQFPPWMAATKAAAMQMAGFYRAIVRKYINISGALQNAADWNPNVDSQLEDALLAGLLPIKKADTGGFYWVSDQTTYTTDQSFVFNSIQAQYAIDTIALTTAQRMERAFVGQSTADVGAALGMAALEGIMADFFRLKLIASSSDASKGFKNARILVNGPVMSVSVEVKLAGALYFVDIGFLVSMVQQSA